MEFQFLVWSLGRDPCQPQLLEGTMGLMDHLASDPRELEGSLSSAASGSKSQPEALSLSLTRGSLSTLQHLYHLGISWESFLFVGYVLLLAHVFFFSPHVSRPSILFK